MQITGKIHEIGAVQNVTDKMTKRELILEYIENPQYPEYLKFECVQDKTKLLDNLRTGQDVEVFFNLRGRPLQHPHRTAAAIRTTTTKARANHPLMTTPSGSQIMEAYKIYNENCLDTMARMPDGFVKLIITSPPYNLNKEYEEKQSMADYFLWVKSLIPEFYRILSIDGSICFQVGNYVDNGVVYPLDCLLFSLFTDIGFIPRNRIIWHFGHGLHCKNRFSGRHETILWFTKSNNYTFNLDSVRVPAKYPNKRHYKGINKGKISGNPLGKNPSDVWDIPNVKHNHPEKTEHPCQFPELLVERIALSLSNIGDTIYDPFAGSGTVGVVCKKCERLFIGSEISEKYCKIAEKRITRAIIQTIML